MASRGFLIRFIDIGLIVLFGFLMISDIDATSHVELADALAAAPEPEPPTEEDDRGVILVDIAPDGVYTISERGLAGEAGAEIDAPGASTTVAGVEALTADLRRRASAHVAEGLETLVMIQPHASSWVQFTVHVMDVCDRLSLTKSLRMDIEVAPPPAPEPLEPS